MAEPAAGSTSIIATLTGILGIIRSQLAEIPISLHMQVAGTLNKLTRFRKSRKSNMATTITDHILYNKGIYLPNSCRCNATVICLNIQYAAMKNNLTMFIQDDYLNGSNLIYTQRTQFHNILQKGVCHLSSTLDLS